MNVIIESLLSGPAAGRTIVPTMSSATIDSIISAFCTEKGIRHHASYILKDVADVVLDNTLTLSVCDVADGDTLYLTTRDGHEMLFGFNNWWFMALIAFVIGFVGFLAVTLLYTMDDPLPVDFGIVFDAGSTHTLMHVYKWAGGKNSGTGVPIQIDRCEVQGDGIATFSNNLEGLKNLLMPCINQSKTVVPEHLIYKTPIYLGATGGMRLLNISNPKNATAVLDTIGLVFSNSGYKYSSNQVSILSGTEEAVDGWTSANFLNNSLNMKSDGTHKSVGTLDLGGASMEIAYEAYTNESTYDIANVSLFGTIHELYSLSYLCYGSREAGRRYTAQLVQKNGNKTLSNPCLPPGYKLNATTESLFSSPCTNMSSSLKPTLQNDTVISFIGTGDADSCALLINELLNETKCKDYKYEYCFYTPKKPKEHMRFMAISNFKFVMEILKLTDNPTLSMFSQRAADLCNTSIQQNLPFNATFCFQAQYALSLLTIGFGFNSSNWNTINFVDQIDGTDVDWALGFMMNETNTIPAEIVVPTLSLTLFIILMICFLFFMLIAIGFATCAWRIAYSSPSYQRFSQYGAI